MINLPIGILLPSFYFKNPSNSWVLCDGKEYSGDNYQELWTLLSTNIIITCTYAEFDKEIATTGSCSKFGINTIDKTFKVPLICNESFIEQGTLGKNYLPGLPNIKGDSGISPLYSAYSIKGAFGVSNKKLATISPEEASKNFEIDFDASRYNSIYGNSSTVQPKAISVNFLVFLGECAAAHATV